MIKFLGFIVFIFEVGVALAVNREFGHPLFRTFNAHDYGEVGQIFSVAEDAQGRMLFGGESAVVAFDNNRWETIPAPGVGYIRSLAVDSHGLVWFSSSTQIGYLSKIDGEYRAATVHNESFGSDCRVIVERDQVYFSTEKGLLIWNNGHPSLQPWPINSLNRSRTLSHGKIWIGDRNGSL
jgi:ligand-binding sensor domain-containing protein